LLHVLFEELANLFPAFVTRQKRAGREVWHVRVAGDALAVARPVHADAIEVLRRVRGGEGFFGRVFGLGGRGFGNLFAERGDRQEWKQEGKEEPYGGNLVLVFAPKGRWIIAQGASPGCSWK